MDDLSWPIDLADDSIVQKQKVAWSSEAGKALLAERIVSKISSGHDTYVEPFAGSGAVLLAQQPVAHEVVNDIDEDVAGAWRFFTKVTPAQIESLKRRKWIGDAATFDRLMKSNPSDPVERMYRFLYLGRFSFNHTRKGTMPKGYQGKEARTAATIEQLAPRVKDVNVESRDYEAVVKDHDGKSTFFFMDPPYAGYQTNIVGHRGEEDGWDEARFAKVLKSIKGRFLVTYGIRGDHDEVFNGFRTERIRHISGVGSHQGVGRKQATTILAMNYDPPVGTKKADDDDWAEE
jgi:DNA adenine methylase